jgi:hypothetical protein
VAILSLGFFPPMESSGSSIGLAAAIRRMYEDEELDFVEPLSTKSGLGSRHSPNRNIKSEQALEGGT